MMKMISRGREELGKVEKIMILLTGSVNLVWLAGCVKHPGQDIQWAVWLQSSEERSEFKFETGLLKACMC